MIPFQWWHNSALPTPEEWQTVLGLLTFLLAAVGIWATVRQVRLGSEANRRSADADEAATRPYLTVTLVLEAHPSSNPKKTTEEGIAYIAVGSIGATPARDITLVATPPFETSGRGRPAGSDPAHAALTKLFSGEFAIGMLAPGQQLKYILDFAKEAMDFDSGRPTSYSVQMSYFDTSLAKHYVEDVVIHIEPWAMTIRQVDPIETIARQVRRISEKAYPPV